MLQKSKLYYGAFLTEALLSNYADTLEMLFASSSILGINLNICMIVNEALLVVILASQEMTFFTNP